MHVLVIGAYGLIGSAVVARIRAAGHSVTGAGRHVGEAARSRPDVRWIKLDLARTDRSQDWQAYLRGIDAVVNCAGVLQDAPSDRMRAVHVEGPDALYAACETIGIRRVVHFSAIGVDREQPTEFSRTKLSLDSKLAARDLDWVILRPAVVGGRTAYGASALIRGLAGLQGVLPIMPDSGPLQVVQLDDVAATVEFFLRPDAPAQCVLELAGPERLTFAEVVLRYRNWLGLPKPRLVPLPRSAARLLYRLGDASAWLGWRPPVRSTAEREIRRGAVGNTAEWSRVTGIEPQSLDAALAAEPASVQEKWFARLYFLKPITIVALSLFWILTGILALGPGFSYGESLMREGGVGGLVGLASIVGGGLLDIMIGIGIAVRRTSKIALLVSILVAVLYAVIGTILVPRLWADPLGPMLKIWPIMVLTLIALAIRNDR